MKEYNSEHEYEGGCLLILFIAVLVVMSGLAELPVEVASKIVTAVVVLIVIAASVILAALTFVGVVAIVTRGYRWAIGRGTDGAEKGEGCDRDGCDGYPTFL
jgi:hypothetical protein